MHRIPIAEDVEPIVDTQRCFHPRMKDVVRKEVIRLLDAGIIYPISDSKWVNPVHCIPRQGGVTIVNSNDNNLTPARTITGYRMCVDFRKLNKETIKEHQPLPFMEQMLERIAKHQYYCFLDGYSGFSQIAIHPEDQEKTNFTCPYGTYAYRRMPFGLCNSPSTFQRCMVTIFEDFVEKFVEVLLNNFVLCGTSFDNCLYNLNKVLQRCEETNLVLNWEHCYFMIRYGIVLGHKISEKGHRA